MHLLMLKTMTILYNTYILHDYVATYVRMSVLKFDSGIIAYAVFISDSYCIYVCYYWIAWLEVGHHNWMENQQVIGEV